MALNAATLLPMAQPPSPKDSLRERQPQGRNDAEQHDGDAQGLFRDAPGG